MSVYLFEKSLVCLVGSSCCGKSSFARERFLPTQILSSDYFRALISDDENDQSVTPQAFDCLHRLAAARLSLGRLTVIDATNLRRADRASFISLAGESDLPVTAIVLDPGREVCLHRHSTRTDRPDMPVRVIDAHHALLSQSLKTINAEGFERVYVLKSAEEIKAAKIELVPIEADRRQDKGPFDIIGDVHGCYDELVKLLAELGYEVNADTYKARHPKGRQAVFLGDLVDLGPNSGGVLRLVMGMVERGSALCVPGNHENKLIRRLTGNSVKTTSGLDITLADLAGQSQGFRERVRAFLSSLVSHYVLDGGRLVVSHAGLPERYHGRRSDRVRQFCLYGETAGEFDGYGPSARLNWAEDYRGRALVVYGHVPVLEVRLSKNTVCLNTGCVFGGYLTAWRYPEGRTVQVKAGRVYCKPIKPLTGEHGTA